MAKKRARERATKRGTAGNARDTTSADDTTSGTARPAARIKHEVITGKILRQRDGGLIDVEISAKRTSIPGLIIHRTLESPQFWNITHEPSGYSVLNLLRARDLKYALAELSGVDWTRSTAELFKDASARGARDRARKIVDARTKRA